MPGWNQTLWLTDQMRIDRDKAVYGQFDYDVTDSFKLTGGIRFYDYRNTLTGFYGYSQAMDSFFEDQHRLWRRAVQNCLSTAVYRGGPGCVDLDKDRAGSVQHLSPHPPPISFDSDRLDLRHPLHRLPAGRHQPQRQCRRPVPARLSDLL